MLDAVRVMESPGIKNVEPFASSRQDGRPVTKRATAHTAETQDGSKNVQQESRDKIERIAEAMHDYVKSAQRDLKIGVDQGTGEVIIKVISKENGEIIREIPPEEMLNLAANMDKMLGTLFNGNA